MAAGLLLVGLARPAGDPAAASAGINKTINYQGRLLNSAGAVVPDGNYNLRFKIYQDGPGNVAGDTGGTLKWTEKWENQTGGGQGVVVKNGYFSVTLGTYCAFSGGSCQSNTNTAIDWNQDTLWLSMDVGGTTTGSPTYDGELLPMRRMSSSVYALQAENANSLGGLTASQFIQNVSPASAQQTANINILSGAATSVAAAQIQAVASATAPVLVLKGGATPGAGADLLQLQNSGGTPLASFNSSGNLFVAGSVDTLGTTGLSVGNANATSITIGKTSGSNITTTISGLTVVKPISGSDSTTAFQVQNASGVAALNVDTTTNIVTAATGVNSPSYDTSPAVLGAIGRTNRVSADSSTSYGTGTYTPAGSFTPSANKILVAYVFGNDTCGGANFSADASEITISGGSLTWVPIVGSGRQDGGCDVGLRSFYAVVGASPPVNMQVTVDAGSVSVYRYHVAVDEFTNVDTTTPVAGAAFSNRQSDPNDTYTLTLAATPTVDDVKVGLNTVDEGTAPGAYDVPAGWTQWHNLGLNSDTQVISQTGSVSTTVNFDLSSTLDSSFSTNAYAGFILKRASVATAPLTLGGTNATSIWLGANTTIAPGKTLTVSSGATSLTGATSGDALTVSNSTSTGNIAVFKDNSTTVATIGDGGATTFRNSTNSSSAFQIQNASGGVVLNADTTPLNTNIDNGNGSFESAVSGWALKAGSGTVARDTTQAYVGSASLKVALTSTASGDGVQYTPSSFSASTQYTLSFSIRQTAGTNLTTNWAFGYNNGSDHNCSPVPSLSSQSVTTSVGGWVRFSCTFTTASSPAPTTIYWKQTDTPASARTFFLDAVQLEAAASANPFTDSKVQVNGVINGPVTFQNTSDSTTAFQIQNAAGTANLMFADTVNNHVNFGTVTQISPAQVYIKNTVDNQKGLIIQGSASQSVDILDIYSGSGSFVAGYDNSGNQFLNGYLQVGTTSSVGQLKFKDGTANNRSVTLDTAALSGSITLHLPDVASGSTVCTTGTVCTGYQASGTAIIQGPSSTAQNTIAPTTNSVVALTVKGTTGTAANVLEIFDSTATPTRQAYFDNTGALNLSRPLTLGSQLTVANGGTGLTSANAFELLAGGTTSTGAFQTIGTGSAGNVLQSNGPGALPSWVGGAGCSTCIAQVPTTTAQNTVTPTANSVVALTVNATSGTSAEALIVNQAKTSNALVVNSNNTTGTQTNGIVFNRSGAGGTTTNAINVNSSGGTLTNGLAFTGTIGTDITRASGTLTVQGAGGISLTTGSGNISVQAAGSGTIAAFQIGAGGVGSTTPDYLGLDVKSTTGDPAGGAEGYLYYNTSDNKFRCFQNTGWVDCVSDLQDAYDRSATASILLANSKDFTVTAADTATDPNILFNLQCTTSCSTNGRFAVQNGGSDVLLVNPNSGSIRVGTATNNVTFASTTYEPSLNGTAQHTRKVSLSPEYAGATFTADGSSNTGTLTTDNMTSSPFRNFYKWTTTQGTAQDYDIWVKIPLPSDFSSMPSGQTICMDTYASATTANTVALTLYGTNNSSVTLTDADLTPSSTTTWQNQCTTSITSGTYAAEGVMTLDIKLTAPATTGDVRIGDITFSYLSKW